MFDLVGRWKRIAQLETPHDVACCGQGEPLVAKVGERIKGRLYCPEAHSSFADKNSLEHVTDFARLPLRHVEDLCHSLRGHEQLTTVRPFPVMIWPHCYRHAS